MPPPHTFSSWTESQDPYSVIDVRTDEGWETILSAYSNKNSKPLERIIDIAKEHGAETVLVEYRYVDADWRSEHANFYGSTFVRYPSVCHRLHFFATKLSADLGELDDQAVADSYRGYSVMRPLPETPVGRTMLSPPPELAAATVTVATEVVHLFGTELPITAMPFISQDALYLRCAHASIWMVLRHAHLRHGLPRSLPGDIRDAGVGGMVVGRQLPSDGLSIAQMLGALDTLGLPTGSLDPDMDSGPDIHPSPGSLSLFGIVCRYINSELPPIVVSEGPEGHAWVVVGWKRVPSKGHGQLTLWRHDDARGPYMKILDPWHEAEPDHQGWRRVLPPLLPKMNLDAERAEAAGASQLTRLIDMRGPGDGEGEEPSRAYEALHADQLTWRTFAVSSNEFKSRLRSRDLPESLTQMFRLVQLPRYVWVVEAVDRVARAEHRADVVASAVFDSTHAGARRAIILPLAAHVETVAFTFQPDHQVTDYKTLEHGRAVLGDHIVRQTHATVPPPRDTED